MNDEPSVASVVGLASADDPRALTAGLREKAVVRIGDMFTLITRREDVEVALRKGDLFNWGGVPMDLGNVRPLIPLQIDAPMHVKYRRILDPLFAPRKVAELEGEVVGLVDQLVANFVGRGACDFHSEFAVPLPCKVFLRLLGLPYADLEFFLEVKDDIIRPAGATLDQQRGPRRVAGDKVYEYFERVLAARRVQPTDDVLGQIIAAEVDGVRLTDDEILDICFLFIIAGLDTVTDSLDCIFAYLAQQPEHRKLIVDDEAAIPGAVEELLRWESPVPAVPRMATEQMEFGGCPIGAGEQVLLLLGSANTDDSGDAGLGEVDLRRSPNPHLAFGGGIHRCLGSHLARLELRVALREFHRRIPDYSLAVGTKLEYTEGLRALHSLPLVFASNGTSIGE